MSAADDDQIQQEWDETRTWYQVTSNPDYLRTIHAFAAQRFRDCTDAVMQPWKLAMLYPSMPKGNAEDLRAMEYFARGEASFAAAILAKQQDAEAGFLAIKQMQTEEEETPADVTLTETPWYDTRE